MKTTKNIKPNYKHLTEIFVAILLIDFANRVHMLDGTYDSKFLGCCSLIAMIGLSIVAIENISKLIRIGINIYRKKMAEIAAEKAAVEKREAITCYICNTKVKRRHSK